MFLHRIVSNRKRATIWRVVPLRDKSIHLETWEQLHLTTSQHMLYKSQQAYIGNGAMAKRRPASQAGAPGAGWWSGRTRPPHQVARHPHRGRTPTWSGAPRHLGVNADTATVRGHDAGRVTSTCWSRLSTERKRTQFASGNGQTTVALGSTSTTLLLTRLEALRKR